MQRLEELEEKLKQSEFKQYLARSAYPSQFETQVERPYIATRKFDSSLVDMNPVHEAPRSKLLPMPTHEKLPKQNTQNTLQVMYYGNKTPLQQTEKKGQFNITKKRKLYNNKVIEEF